MDEKLKQIQEYCKRYGYIYDDYFLNFEGLYITYKECYENIKCCRLIIPSWQIGKINPNEMEMFLKGMSIRFENDIENIK